MKTTITGEKRTVFVENNIKFVLLFVLFTILPDFLKADTNYFFKQISIEQGLSQPSVSCILNDCNGLIWIGTRSGLNSFDQHELKNYFHEKEVSNSLPGNQIYFIIEDSLQMIWIGTSRGLVTYNREKDNFIPVKCENKTFDAFSYLFVSGGVIFGGRGALYRYSFADRSIREMEINPKSKQNSEFSKLLRWDGDNFIISVGYEGLYLYNMQRKSLDILPFCQEKNISSVYVDSIGRVWVSVYNGGIICYSHTGEKLHHYTKTNSNLSNEIVLDMLEKDSQMWFATDGGGINILDYNERDFTIIENHPGDVYSLPANSINLLYNDSENNLWVGTVRNGLLGIKQVFIRTFKDIFQNSTFGLNNKSVVSLYKDDDGILWIGTDGGGLNSYDCRTGRFEHILSTYPEKVVSITPYSQDELLVSFFCKGLYLFNKKSRLLSPFILVNWETNKIECTSGYSVHVKNYAKNKYLFLAGRIYLYDKAKNEFSKIHSQDSSVQSMLKLIESNDSVSYLFGRLHVARLDHRTKRFSILLRLKYDSPILSACCDENGNIWIGTETGLVKYNISDKKIVKISTSLFSSITSLALDDRGRIWIGARNLLFCYIIAENRFTILGESDGVYPNEFFHIPTVQDKSYVYMGGASGMLRIDKNIDFQEDSQPQVKLMDVVIDGLSAMGEINNEHVNKISIPWNHTSVVVKLIAKEKDLFRKKQYRYSIVGLDKKYQETYNHIMNIRSLLPGDYTIMASCSTRNGTWSIPVKVLSISVVPPWWKSTWFILISIVLVILGVVTLVMTIIHRGKVKLKWEMKEYENRTYEEKIHFLTNISHELRTPLTLIYAPLQRLLDKGLHDEYLDKQLTGIYKQAKQLKNIVNMLLDVRKMDVGKDILHIIPHDLNTWLGVVADDFQNEYHVKKVELCYDFDESIRELSFDESKCEIVISNLLMNALKFSDSNTKVVLSTHKTSDGQSVRISVSDQGIGLDDVEVDKLFTRFYQGNHGRNGSGIGLSYSKILVEKHNGKIGAFGKKEEPGAVFFFELPITDVQTQDSSLFSLDDADHLSFVPEQAHHDAEKFDISSYTLLIVEDELDMRDFLMSTLREYFKHVYVAPNGEKALLFISRCYPDIVISDVMMPCMNGFELCKKVKEGDKISHIPVILLTAYNESEGISAGYEFGADAYLVKPFEIDFLLTVVRNQLKNRVLMKAKYKNASFECVQKTLPNNADEQFLIKLNSLMLKNICNPEMDPSFLISEMTMGRASFYSKIKILTGMGIGEYINKFRIDRAAALLAETNLSVLEIAEQTGFTYSTYFSSVFKSLKGVSPSKYRQSLAKNDSIHFV